MSEELVGHPHFDVGTDGSTLKMSDRLCVSLVRALVSDTEVLLVSSVLDVLGEERGRKVVEFLKAYVRSCGLPGLQHELPLRFRHRKTVMYTSW